ncbi:MAG: hypothetical protein DMF24_06460 [Verrucomicrobia bacterium]|nr:MAG: hypothetical protein DMF24_06460 [Verrucomicrobiota bacterium]
MILLPVFVLLRSFSLLFLRQFGPDYDAWANYTYTVGPIPWDEGSSGGTGFIPLPPGPGPSGGN